MSVTVATTPNSAPSARFRAPGWVRRAVRIALLVICIALVFRLTLTVLLPFVIGRTARAFGVTCEYDRMKLSVLGTNATLWGVKVRSRDQQEELFNADYVNANLSTLRLLSLRLLVWRVEADDVNISLVRRADGSIPLLAHLAAGSAAAPGVTGPAPGASRPADFDAPLELRALRLHGVTVQVRDESVSPPFEETVRLDLRVSDIGRPGGPAQVQFVMGSDGLFSAARLSGEVVAAGPSLGGEFLFSLQGLQADRAAPYLAAAGWSADDRSIDIAGRASLALKASATRPGAVEGAASLSEITVRAASATVAGLAKADAVIAGLSPSELHLSELRIEDGFVRAERGTDGRLRLAAFSPAAAPARSPLPRAAEVPPPGTPAAARAASPLRWRVDSVVGGSLKALLEDRAVVPANALALEVSAFSARDLSNHGSADATTAFDARLSAPGLVGEIRMNGQASPFQPQPVGAATIELDGIRPDALAPYLRALGIESTLQGASVRVAVSGSMAGEAGADTAGAALVLEHVVVRDQGRPVVEVGPVTVRGIGIGVDGGLEVASIEGSGPSFEVRRLADGRVETLGVRLGNERSASSALARADDAGSAPLSAGGVEFPSIRVGRFAWGAVAVRFEDLGLPGSAPLELTDAGVEIANLVLGPRPSEQGTLRVWARAPGAIDSLDIAGQLTSGENAIAIDGTAAGKSISLAGFAPYLEPLGIRPTLGEGEFAARWSARVAGTEGGVQLSFGATEAALKEGDATWLKVAHAGVDRVDLESERVAIGQIALAGCELVASRDRDGAFGVAGLTLLPTVGAADAGALPDPLALIEALGDLSVEGLRVEGLKLHWTDEALKEPLTVTASLDGTAGPLALNRAEAPAAPFNLRLISEGGTEQIAVSGTLRAAGDGVSAEARVAARGLSAKMMAAYLPAGVEPALDRGELDVASAVAVGRAAEGGYTAKLDVHGLEYRDSAGPSTLARVDSFALDIGRMDPATGDVIVTRIAADGVEADARLRADGTIELLGLALVPAPDAPDDLSPTPPEQQADVAAIVQGSLSAPPLFAVDVISLQVERLGFTRDGAAPVSLSGVRVRNTTPIRLLGPTPEENPPAAIEIVGAVDPLIGEFRVAGEASPFAARPTFDVSIAAAGIDGAAITVLAPELAGIIDGSSLTDGRFNSRIVGEANIRRRGGGRIDLSRGLDVTLTVQDTTFRAGESGPLLAGVERIHADQVKFEPSTGNVTAKSVEVGGASGNAWRDETGVHVLGLVMRPLSGTPSEDGPPAEETAVALGVEPSAEQERQPALAASSEPSGAGPEIRIERLSATGLDFRFEDRLLDPPVVVPIDEMDLEVRGLSSQILERDRPVRFNLSVGSGAVPVPVKPPGGAIAGALTDMGSMADEIAPAVEDREFFSQFIGSGTMSFYPVPRGRALLSINGLQLAAIRGLAQAAGASLGGGVFDARVDLRARDDGAVSVRSRLVLTDLRYAEPPSGPVERYMSLPVPIDAAIAAVEAPDGSITLPVDVTLDERGLTTGKLVGAVARGAGQVVAVAVLSAPVKIIGGFAGLLVDTRSTAVWVEEEPIIIEYPPGVSTLSRESLEPLLGAISRARLSKRVQVSVEHQLGAADSALAARRANPVAEDAAALVQDLRVRREVLKARRAEMLGTASAAAMGLPVDPGSVDGLRRVHEDLAAVEETLDRLYELQRPGAESQAERRSRAAAIELIDARMGTVRQLVARVGGSGTSRIAVAGSRIEPAKTERSRLVVRVRQQR